MRQKRKGKEKDEKNTRYIHNAKGITSETGGSTSGRTGRSAQTIQRVEREKGSVGKASESVHGWGRLGENRDRGRL